jgi:hypothetical protein
MIRHGVNAPWATARMLSLMAESLPVGAQLDLIVSTPIVLQALGSCADVRSKGWDIDTYCQDPEWKDVMVLWKNRHSGRGETVPVEMKWPEGSDQ